MKDKIFYTAGIGFLLGTLTRSFIFADTYFALFLFLIAIVFCHFKTAGICVFLFAFSLGILRFQLADSPVPAIPPEVRSFTGIIIEEPNTGLNTQKLTVQIELPEPVAAGRFKSAGGSKTKILVTAGLEQHFSYGDEINLEGKLIRPENFLTDQGKIFDYVSYLRKDNIFYVMVFPKISILSEDNGNFLQSVLFSAKEKFLSVIRVNIPEPESTLMGGLILGERSSFSDDMRREFVNTGTIHIVALSGYNVTIVADWIMKLLAFMPKAASFGAGILGIILFIIMAGGQSTAVRAGIMAVLGLLARALGRTYDAGRGLVLAAVAMVLLNPFVLAFDVSFQLSFIATAAVIFGTPKFEKYFYWIKLKWLREIAATTSAAYVCVAPYIFYQMGNLSLVALPANILVLPVIPFTMVLGFATGFLGFLSPYLSVLLGYFSYALLHYELWIIGIMAKIPFASISVRDFSLTIILLFYVAIIWKPLRNFFQSPPN